MKAPTASSRRLLRVRGRVPVTLAAGMLLSASSLAAQAADRPSMRDSWAVSVMAGLLAYDPSDDDMFPTFSVRADTPLADYARIEVETAYSRPDVQQDENARYDPSLPTESANLFSLTIGVQFRRAWGPLEPYAGASGGLFARVDDDPDGQRFSRNTFTFPFGLRLWVSDHLGVRGEYRIRRDNHEIFTYMSTEMTVGAFWTF